MKYVAPEMEIVTLSADTAVANEISTDFSGLISENSKP